MTNFTLHTGRKIPAIAFGTGTSYFNRSDDVIEGIIKAFDAGFRYIDTAIAYGTEEGVGKAVKKLIEVYLFHKN
jgi:diketogulonate reductase-like aldo/keto reductase